MTTSSLVMAAEGLRSSTSRFLHFVTRLHFVTPAKAGVQFVEHNVARWIPAFAGMTNKAQLFR
jgi:hypothetical protein